MGTMGYPLAYVITTTVIYAAAIPVISEVVTDEDNIR